MEGRSKYPNTSIVQDAACLTNAANSKKKIVLQEVGSGKWLKTTPKGTMLLQSLRAPNAECAFFIYFPSFHSSSSFCLRSVSNNRWVSNNNGTLSCDSTVQQDAELFSVEFLDKSEVKNDYIAVFYTSNKESIKFRIFIIDEDVEDKEMKFTTLVDGRYSNSVVKSTWCSWCDKNTTHYRQRRLLKTFF
jgi:hypothetical protein